MAHARSLPLDSIKSVEFFKTKFIRDSDIFAVLLLNNTKFANHALHLVAKGNPLCLHLLFTYGKI